MDIVKSTRIETLLAGGSAGIRMRTVRTGGSAAPATQVSTPAPAAQRTAAPPTSTYKIGDIGPAGGGVVFYDMGFYMDGWRYLEAAPQNFPVSVKWTNAGIGIFSTE